MKKKPSNNMEEENYKSLQGSELQKKRQSLMNRKNKLRKKGKTVDDSIQSTIEKIDAILQQRKVEKQRRKEEKTVAYIHMDSGEQIPLTKKDKEHLLYAYVVAKGLAYMVDSPELTPEGKLELEQKYHVKAERTAAQNQRMILQTGENELSQSTFTIQRLHKVIAIIRECFSYDDDESLEQRIIAELENDVLDDAFFSGNDRGEIASILFAIGYEIEFRSPQKGEGRKQNSTESNAILTAVFAHFTKQWMKNSDEVMNPVAEVHAMFGKEGNIAVKHAQNHYLPGNHPVTEFGEIASKIAASYREGAMQVINDHLLSGSGGGNHVSMEESSPRVETGSANSSPPSWGIAFQAGDLPHGIRYNLVGLHGRRSMGGSPVIPTGNGQPDTILPRVEFLANAAYSAGYDVTAFAPAASRENENTAGHVPDGETLAQIIRAEEYVLLDIRQIQDHIIQAWMQIIVSNSTHKGAYQFDNILIDPDLCAEFIEQQKNLPRADIEEMLNATPIHCEDLLSWVQKVTYILFTRRTPEGLRNREVATNDQNQPLPDEQQFTPEQIKLLQMDLYDMAQLISSKQVTDSQPLAQALSRDRNIVEASANIDNTAIRTSGTSVAELTPGLIQKYVHADELCFRIGGFMHGKTWLKRWERYFERIDQQSGHLSNQNVLERVKRLVGI